MIGWLPIQANKYNMNNRNLSYKAFLEALALVAFELDVEFDDVVAMLGVTPVPKEVEAMAIAPSQDIQEIQDYGSPDTSRQRYLSKLLSLVCVYVWVGVRACVCPPPPFFSVSLTRGSGSRIL